MHHMYCMVLADVLALWYKFSYIGYSPCVAVAEAGLPED